MKPRVRPLVGAVALAIPCLAASQPAKEIPAKTAAPLAYRSAFDGYQRFEAVTAGDWKALNAAVAQGNARHGMHMPPPAATPASTPAMPMPDPAGHAGPGAMK